MSFSLSDLLMSRVEVIDKKCKRKVNKTKKKDLDFNLPFNALYPKLTPAHRAIFYMEGLLKSKARKLIQYIFLR